MLELDRITRTFGDRMVLDEVSLTVAPGRLTGFVGGNGAGKTTTMRIILGVLGADSGQVLLDGSPLRDDQRRHFGYMPEERGLYPKMKVHEQLTYLARLHGFTSGGAASRALDLLERLGLGERANDRVEDLSLGNQQRAQIAAALVHEPTALILDEPFSGLDPMAVETVLTVLTEHAARGVPVLFSSHQLDVVERLCDDLVIIADGRIAAAGDRESLSERYAAQRYVLRTADDIAWLRATPGVTVVEFDGGHALFEAEADAAQHVLRAALDRGVVHAFGPDRPTLAEVFREIVTDSQRLRHDAPAPAPAPAPARMVS